MAATVDVLVVGAGSAGATLAARLTEDPATRVLLLEAGGGDRHPNVAIPAAFNKLFRTRRDWDYWTEPQPELDSRRVYWPRGRMLGGSSSMNAQMYIRGHRVDYDAWGADNPGWSYAEVLDCFRRSERNSRGESEWHGSHGPLDVQDLRDPTELAHAFVAAAVDTGIKPCDDLAGPDLSGVGLTQVTQRRGRRASTADAFLRPNRHRPNLDVRTGAQVARILVDGGRARGVELVDGERLAADVVVLAGGAINTPQLLMLSGIGPADHLREHGIAPQVDLPGVGGNLQDHLIYPLIVDVNSTQTLAAAERPAALRAYLLHRRGLLTSNVAEAAAFVRADGTDGVPDLELVFAPVPYENQGLGKPDRHAITLGVELLTPDSHGTIRLGSANPAAPAVIDPAYLTDPQRHDLRRLLAGWDQAEEILHAPALARYVTSSLDLPDRAAHVRATAQTLYHPVGTCRMGADDAAVVDHRLRVHGVDGLLVADASVIPNVIRGHTNAAAIMIGDKAADLLR